MGPRAKGKASKTSSPLSAVRLLPTEAIAVEDPASAPSEVSPPSAQPPRKKAKKVSVSEKAKADTLKKKEYIRGRVAAKECWE